MNIVAAIVIGAFTGFVLGYLLGKAITLVDLDEDDMDEWDFDPPPPMRAREDD